MPTPADLQMPEEALGDTDRYQDFLDAFAPVQLRVLMYICALIHDWNDANDVFQETSLVVWREYPTFQREGNFLNWVLGIARHRVLMYWRTRRRDLHVFNESLLASLAAEAGEYTESLEARQHALDECVERLTERQRGLVRAVYGEGKSANEVADSWGRSIHAVYKALKVMRRSLLDCVEQKLAEGL